MSFKKLILENKKLSLAVLFFFVAIFYSNNTQADLLSSTSCAGSGHYATYAQAKSAVGSACSGGVGYSRGYVERSTSYSWECTGWNGSGYVTTANCSVSWNPDPAPTVATCPTSQTTSDPTTSGSGGCSSGTYYCEVVKKCIPTSTSCNTGIKDESILFQLNPNIKADKIGPIYLKGLFPSPSIGNPGYSCRIDWGDRVFKSYDYYTRCTFSTPTGNIEFSPGSTTAPTFYTVNNVIKDTVLKMSCIEKDGSSYDSEEAVCRVNWNYKEVN